MRSRHTLEDTLLRLDRSARRMLEPGEARMLRDEIQAHLEASILARMELGETPEEAERHATRDFGDVSLVIKRMREEQNPRGPAISPPFTAALTVGGILSSGVILFRRDTPALMVLLSLLGCLAATMIATWPLRRLQWRSFLIALLPAWLCFSLVLSFTYRRPFLADGSRTAAELRETLGVMRPSNERFARYLEELEAGYEQFRQKGGLQVPRDMNQETGAVKYGRAKSEEAARRSWELTRSSFPEQHAGLEANRAWDAQAEAAIGRSWIQEFPYEVPWALGYALLGFAYFGFGHFIVLFLRWFFDEVKRIRRQMGRA